MIVVLLVHLFTFPYFLFLSHLLQFPVLPVSSQNPVEHARSRSFLQRTSPHSSILSFHVLSVPSAFPFPILPMFVPHFPSKILLSMPAPGSSCSVPPFLFLPYFPVLFILSLLSLIVFFFPFCFTGLFLKTVFVHSCRFVFY